MGREVVKIKKKIIILCLFSFFIGLVLGSPNILKSGNPFNVLIGMAKLSVTDEEIVQISKDPVRFITLNKDGTAPLHDKVYEEGQWEFNNLALGKDTDLGIMYSKGNKKKAFYQHQLFHQYRVWEDAQ